MVASGHRLIRSGVERALIDELARRHPRVGLDGVRRGMPRIGLRVPARAPAVRRAVAWDAFDQLTQRWWPQGIDVDPAGSPLVVVSWYAHPGHGRAESRVTFLDPRGPLPRYRHVLLVEPRRDQRGRVRMAPVPIHAGGIAWAGDRLLVAAASAGVREFHLGDILRLEGGALPLLRRFGGRFVLPQSAAYAPEGDRPVKYSFLSIESGETQEDGFLVAGEYSRRDGARLVRTPVRPGEDGGAEIEQVHAPGIQGMQGVVVADGTWYVTASAGERTGGDLWVGDPAGFRRYAAVLPPGPEDIAWDPRRRLLWTHTEWPARRRVVTIDPADFPA